MANVLSSIVKVTGTSDGTPAQQDFSFSGGTSLSKEFHFCSFRGNVADTLHDKWYRSTSLTGINQLSIFTGDTASPLALSFVAFIVIFTVESDLVVNQYTTATNVSELTNVTITTVSALAQAFVIPHGQNDPIDTTVGQEELWRVRLTSTTNVEYALDDISDEVDTCRFEVVDWNNADIRVQHLIATMTSGETTDTVVIPSAVVLSKSWIIGSFRTAGSGAFSEQTNNMAMRMDLQDTTTMRLRRTAGGTLRNIEWAAQVIEDVSIAGIWNIDQANIAMTTAQLSNTTTIGIVDAGRTFVCGTLSPAFGYVGQSPDITLDNFDNAQCTIDLTDSTTITAERGVTDTQILDIIVQAIEFLPDKIFISGTLDALSKGNGRMVRTTTMIGDIHALVLLGAPVSVITGLGSIITVLSKINSNISRFTLLNSVVDTITNVNSNISRLRLLEALIDALSTIDANSTKTANLNSIVNALSKADSNIFRRTFLGSAVGVQSDIFAKIKGKIIFSAVSKGLSNIAGDIRNIILLLLTSAVGTSIIDGSIFITTPPPKRVGVFLNTIRRSRPEYNIKRAN